MKGILYIVTNDINNKVYIGKTYTSIETRWERHIQDAFRVDRNTNTKFYNALRKYGPEHFKINIIGQFEEGILEKKEIEFIQKYNSYTNGYNSTLGGEGVSVISLDEDYVLELYNSGHSLSSIAKELNTGTTRTISAILKRNGIHISRQTQCEVYQYNLSGEFIQKFDSKMAAWKWLTENYKVDIKKCTAYYCIKKSSDENRIAFGYKWKQVETDNIGVGSRDSYNKYTYYCNVYDKDGNLVLEGITVADAARFVVNNRLATSADDKSVRKLIMSIGKGWIYGLYFEVFKEIRDN